MVYGRGDNAPFLVRIPTQCDPEALRREGNPGELLSRLDALHTTRPAKFDYNGHGLGMMKPVHYYIIVPLHQFLSA
jgi:hypothetical protein